MLILDSTTDYKSMLAEYSAGGEITIRFSYPSKETLRTINSLIAQILSSRDRIFLLETIITILRECIFNAVKANAKRLFFEQAGVNITDSQQYDKLIQRFKDDVIMSFNAMQATLTESKYKAEFIVIPGPESFTIKIFNNVPILPAEAIRIRERMQNAMKYNDFNEVYEDMYDDTEGAGLGIVLTMLLLKNSGINPKSFTLSSDGSLTLAQLIIPDQLRPQELSTDVKRQIAEQVRGLPTFPQMTLELMEMANHPDASLQKIGDRIKSDPSLTADILKLANSAGFVSTRKVDTINDALVRIGLKNLRNILIAASSRTILEKRFKKFEAIWAHCFKTAYYAKMIANQLKLPATEDQAFICGLLHDMGKIVLLTVDLDLTNKIADIVAQHRIRTTTVIEEISIGISHSAIGKLIAQRWNFNEFLIQGIEYHHSPLQAKEEFRNIVFATYLANLFCGIESKKYEYSFIDSLVLEGLGIPDEAAAEALHLKLKDLYDKQPV
jgi:putative nucleotidyltransferase with HDIG domain